MKTIKKTAILLALLMLLSTGCHSNINDSTIGGDKEPQQSENDKRDETPKVSDSTAEFTATRYTKPRDLSAKPFTYTNADSAAVTDFAMRLFKSSYESGKNTTLSPYSIMYALGMLSLGANENTLAQMEEVLGLDRDTLAETLTSIRAYLVNSQDNKVSLNSSVWVKESGFIPNDDFVNAVSEIYGADMFSAPFNASTKNDINSWVEENTMGMIKKIIDEIPEDAVMYLINTLALDLKWADQYNEYQVSDGTFTEENGAKKDVKLMHSTEHSYLKGDNYIGFIKYYQSYNYGFAAILPDENTTVSSLVTSLEAENLRDMLMNPQEGYDVITSTPKFTSEYDIELSENLTDMGMSDAFDSEIADFTGLGKADDNVYVNRVLHKTYVEVNEAGTKAAAVTAVEMMTESAFEPRETKEVILDRPFMYVIFECETGVPLFIGTYESIK